MNTLITTTAVSSKLLTRFPFFNKLFKTILIVLIGICSTTTASAQCGGDPAIFGNNEWIGYHYKSSLFSKFSSYRGFKTEAVNFDNNYLQEYTWLIFPVPHFTVCDTEFTNDFAIRYKMRKHFTAGCYTFTIGGDDGFRLSLDGGNTWVINSWSDHIYETVTYTVYLPAGNKDLVLEYYENDGDSRISFNVEQNASSTAPTTIAGPSSVCAPSGTITLTASGGTHRTGAVYQWGTGTVGNNIIAQTGSSISVNPASTTTTYWVRRIDAAPCAQPSAAITHTLNVATRSTAPTSISGTPTVCPGSSVTLTANGGTHGSNTSYQWGTGAVGTNIIANQTGSTLTVSLLVSTSYWVRRRDAAPCNVTTNGISYTVNVLQQPTAPTTISGNLCNTGGGTTLTVSGGNLNSVGVYQWGTGNVAGANIVQTGNSTSYYVNPAAATTYWVRAYNPNCGYATDAVFATVVRASTAPDYIAYVPPVCEGSAVTLNAIGGVTGTNGSFQWGSGDIGSNIIPGATGASVTVSPTDNTVYWVRRIDTAPCSTTTDAKIINVTIATKSTAPTSISSTTIFPLCPGTGGTTLTANGGIAASGVTYQWGTGSVVGSNIIAGQTSASMYINPSATTTYWVRRVDGTPCNTPTTGISIEVPVATYSTTPTSISGSSSTCAGASITLTAVGGSLAPGGVYQWGTGYSVGSNIIAGETGVSITVAPNTQTVYWVRTVDAAPCYQSWIWGPTKVVSVQSGSTAPTTIYGVPATSCPGSAVTLTASGGSAGAGSYYQWGTGSVAGSNIIAGTGSSITVNPAVTTTYWVRRYDAACGSYTAAKTTTVTIATATVAGTLSTPVTTVCGNSAPSNITLTGNIGTVVRWQKSNNSGFNAGVTNIASTSNILTSDLMGAITTTTYYRAVVQGSCSTSYTTPIAITVPAPVTFSGGVWNGTVTEATSVIITGNLTLDSDLSVCSCKVNGASVLTIPAGKTLTVQKAIEVMPNANIIVENNGSIVQTDDASVNAGTITYKRQTSAVREMDFTYWSSPVQNTTLYNLSPTTRFDKYMSFNPLINNWTIHQNGAAQMIPGAGYIVRSPQGWSLTNASQGKYTAAFTGVPNNGVIPVAIKKGAGTFNLIGNPYPSAIDIDLFLTDPANADLVNGTVYLWTHNTAISSSIPGAAAFNYAADDYAKYNLTGGVKTASAATSGGAAPTGKIAAGQGFFIEANSALANGTYTAHFNNSMRVAGENNQFFRPLEKHRLWLNISNSAGAYDEMLIGYVEGATNGLDAKFDGATFPAGNAVGLYSVLDQSRLSIQGRALPFNSAEVIPVGYQSTIAGVMSIAIENFDGVFSGTDVYLFDTSTATIHNLKTAPYSFTTAVGTFDSRFEIHFNAGALGIDPIETVSDVVIFADNSQINIDAANNNISSVQIFDLTGKLLLADVNVDTNRYVAAINAAPQLLLVHLTLEDGITIKKKVLLH